MDKGQTWPRAQLQGHTLSFPSSQASWVALRWRDESRGINRREVRAPTSLPVRVALASHYGPLAPQIP